MIVENVRSKDLRAGDKIVSGPNGGGSLDTYAFWTVERDEPEVPALPVEPYTAIRVTWRGGSDVGRLLLLGDDGLWTGRMSSQAVASAITGFEVLSEPRAVTARAVLDRCEELAGYPVSIVQTVRREFGASS